MPSNLRVSFRFISHVHYEKCTIYAFILQIRKEAYRYKMTVSGRSELQLQLFYLLAMIRP